MGMVNDDLTDVELAGRIIEMTNCYAHQHTGWIARFNTPLLERLTVGLSGRCLDERVCVGRRIRGRAQDYLDAAATANDRLTKCYIGKRAPNTIMVLLEQVDPIDVADGTEVRQRLRGCVDDYRVG